MPSLTKKDFQDALDVQNAGNILGVVASFHQVLPKIHSDTNGSVATARHPITMLYAAAISYLAGSIFADLEGYHNATVACREGAGHDHQD